jgi:hypothetical protein
MLNSLRQRFAGDDAQADVAKAGRSTESEPLPGYDRTNAKHLVADLSNHSQAELGTIETYERSHKKRSQVFDKLRYLRGKEPLQDYDSLAVNEILAGLEGADTDTLRRTRVYERKFQRRPDVLEPVATALHRGPPVSTPRG